MFQVTVLAPRGQPESLSAPSALMQAVIAPLLMPTGLLPEASATTALARKAAPATRMIRFKVMTLPVGIPRIPARAFLRKCAPSGRFCQLHEGIETLESEVRAPG